jgi:hypothetical protein
MKLLQGDPQQKLTWTFEHAGVFHTFEFCNGTFRHPEVKKSIGGKKTANGFGTWLDSHDGFPFNSVSPGTLGCIRTDTETKQVSRQITPDCLRMF